jgi:homoserine dehydrogenase
MGLFSVSSIIRVSLFDGLRQFVSKETPKKFNVGICGLGTVGCGTLALIQGNSEELCRKLGRNLQVTHVATRTPRDDINLDGIKVSGDIFDVVTDPDVDVVVETIGGFDPALDLVLQAVENGKHVVTANKALIAVHGNQIFAKAQEKNVTVAYESSVAGGIPIIKALREGLAANKIDWLAGIINGTGNFILTEMAAKQRQFEDVLIEAQELGYAEADPTFDVEGIDAAHKLTIMASVAFGIPLQFEKTYTEGISQITPEDVVYAKELGYHIKHLGIAQNSAKGVEMRVHPTLISSNDMIANVDGVGNAILVHGNAVGATLYCGPGAGAEATASSVVADIMDIARLDSLDASAFAVPALGFRNPYTDAQIMDIEDISSEYYLRIQVQDKVGVMARITSVLQDCGISIEAVIQKEAVSETLPIVLLTHKVAEKDMNKAIQLLEGLSEVSGQIARIRVAPFADGTI